MLKEKLITVLKFLLPLGLIMVGGGCTSPSPEGQQVFIVNSTAQTPAMHNYYIVQRGDTLVSIALEFGLDVKDLVKINHLTPPYEVRVGQQLELFRGTDAEGNKFLASKKVTHWLWPASGTVVQPFSKGGIVPNNGIDITGNIGEPVVASATGKVVYCGSGLSSYGKLIIVKHNEDFTSTYALNKNIYVSEGQFVKAGQHIADMGANSAERAILHFEIRYNGKPVNPMHFLVSKSVTKPIQ